jgi:MarR family transcriptional regulator, temperature-dependent positive regulator of motility
MSSSAQPSDTASSGTKYSSFLTFKLDLVRSEMIGLANTAYRKACGLDVRSLRILRAICDSPGLSATAVRELTLIEKTLLSKLLADLLKRKVVRRTVHPDDARQFQFWPTPAGSRLRTASDELGWKLEAEMLSVLAESERKDLDRLLTKLADAFQDQAASQGDARDA